MYLFFRDGRSGPIFQGEVQSLRANLEAVLFLDMHEALKTSCLGEIVLQFEPRCGPGIGGG